MKRLVAVLGLVVALMPIRVCFARGLLWQLAGPHENVGIARPHQGKGAALTPAGSPKLAAKAMRPAASTTDVMSFGAKCDVATASHASMQAGSNTLTSRQSLFSLSDVGKVVAVLGAGAAWNGKPPISLPHATLFSTVRKVIDPHTLQLSDSASVTVADSQTSWATDDSAAIQSALSQLKPNGQLTFSGLCGVGHAGWQGLSVNASNVALSGTGSGTGLMVFFRPEQWNGAGSIPVTFKIRNQNGVAIENLEINGNGVPAILLGLAFVSNSVVSGNYFHSTGNGLANGVYSVGGRGNTYKLNRVSHCGRGLWLGNAPPDPATSYVETDVTVVNNRIEDNIWSGIAGTMQNTLIDGNTILRNGGSGIPLGSGPTCIYRHATISHNVIGYNGFDGVQSDDPLSTGGPENITIEDNTLDHNGRTGISATVADHWTIKDNTIYDNGQLGKGGDGVWISNAKYIIVESNHIYDDQATPTQGNGVGVTCQNIIEGIQDVAFDGNIITGNKLDGIKITSGLAQGVAGTGDTITIGNNTVHGNGRYGIEINPGYHNITVKNNIVHENAKADFRGDVRTEGRDNDIGAREGQPIHH